MDNGSEFIVYARQEWAAEDGTIRAFIVPGQPWHNGFVESFHNRMTDEFLEDDSIENLDPARMLLDQWSRRYNEFHPHSLLGCLSPRKYAETMETRKHGQSLSQLDQILRPPQFDREEVARNVLNKLGLKKVTGKTREFLDFHYGWVHYGKLD